MGWTVFLSYRRTDASGHVGRLYDGLVQRFGREQVFIDVASIGGGSDFSQAIAEAISSSLVMVVVIGPTWHTAADERGLRLEASEDVVRLEIETALAGGTRVIPVLVNGASMPGDRELPEAMRGLARANAIELTDARWSYDLERLISALESFGVTPTDPVPAGPGSVRRMTRVPVPSSALVGRTEDLAAIADLVRRAGVRLVTLTGPGGIGKTRLAMEVGIALMPEFQGEVCFVDLSVVAHADAVVDAIAAALSLSAASGRSIRQELERDLRDRRLLLIVDNFEHLLDAAPDVAWLMALAPLLKIIATSRAPLRVSGEHEYDVPPLTVPPPGHGPSAKLLDYGAVRLFIERAQAVRPSFSLTEDTAPALAEICMRLDGLPLAIELAAARVKMVSLPDMLDRLAESMGFLTGRARDLPARQQTLRATIDWSYRLLEHPEQKLLSRLAVFVGGWTLDTAEAVCHDDLGVDVFEGLESLVDKSLVNEPDSSVTEPRFSMLEVIRGFAFEQLTLCEEAEPLRERHAHYFASLAESSYAAIKAGTSAGTWLARLDSEWANIRSALNWSAETGNSTLLLQMAGALDEFWAVCGRREAAEWLTKALDGESRADAPRARALLAAARLAYEQADYAASRDKIEEALGLYRKLGDLSGEGRALARLASSYAFDTGTNAKGAMISDEAMSVMRRAGDVRALAGFTANAGYLALVAGDIKRAEKSSEEAVALLRETDYPSALILAIQNLAFVKLEQRQPFDALPLIEEATHLAAKLTFRRGIAYSLLGLAALATRTEHHYLAAGALGGVDAWIEADDDALEPYEHRLYDETTAAAQDALGSPSFTTATTDGKSHAKRSLSELALRVADALRGAFPELAQKDRSENRF